MCEDKQKICEDKQKILDLLLPALQATRQYRDLGVLFYDEAHESVIAVYKNGATTKANVACDSGAAMIRDVLEAIR